MFVTLFGMLGIAVNLNPLQSALTKDLLLEVPVPQQSGYNTVLANIGEMQ